ncbi:MAG: 50S ribosomal protein L18 [Acidobacteriota bacterium]|nr:50S ribosomal protein L18 [Acidobacteriota bacterium]
MDKSERKRARRFRAHRRVRRRVSGSEERPRLAIFKSLRYIYAQVIDDVQGVTLVQANSKEDGIRGDGTKNLDAARLVGEAVAERALEKGIRRVVFDRGGYIYHGRVRKVAEGARSKGLEF